MNNTFLANRASKRKHKNGSNEIISPPSFDDLVLLTSLGAHGRAKARRFIEAGEIETCRRGGKLYATRAELADWEVIDFDADVTTAGEFLGDAAACL